MASIGAGGGTFDTRGGGRPRHVFFTQGRHANIVGRLHLDIRRERNGKDAAGCFGAEAAQLLRAWLGVRREATLEDYLFVDRNGRSLTRNHAMHILHRLSIKAGLSRKVGPHALRHYAATSILRQTGDLELVRQVLRHESLAMSLRYAHIAKPEISQAGLAPGQPAGGEVIFDSSIMDRAFLCFLVGHYTV